MCLMNWVIQLRRFPGKVLKMPSGLFWVFVVKWKMKEINEMNNC